MLEERVLSNRTLRRALALGREKDWLTVLMTSDRKLSLVPRDAAEEQALSTMHGLAFAPREGLDAEFVVRVTFFSRDHGRSLEFGDEVERAIGEPVYVTHFPLSVLASHRASPFQVVDVHPPCRGKAEALRILEEVYGIPARRVVAVGDATNDLPMLEAAGLAVAMEDGMEEARAAAHRIIGGCDTTAIADLVEEIFFGAPGLGAPAAESPARSRA
jgi:hydroxymethylpyrimidine pyrophosphatase-like HAD family hydrolase